MTQTTDKPSRRSYFRKHYHPPGTAPGTLTERPPAPDTGPLRIRLVDYSPEHCSVQEDVAVDQCLPFLNRDTVSWVHVQGPLTADTLRSLGTAFGLHSLAMEDVFNSGQRPKIEAFDHQLFLIMSLPLLQDGVVITRQVSLFAHAGHIISFCEGPDDPFAPLLRRIQTATTNLRRRGTDYLLYAILDLVIDQGFPVLESFGLQLEELEQTITTSVDRSVLDRIHSMRRELILLRRMVWPQREVITQLLHEDQDLISGDTRIFLRDCYDHTVQIMDLLETYRDMSGSILDIYLSSVNNRLNETMRVLAVIATIFMPLTFISGIYGMNFDRSSPWNMPELGWHYGYPLVLLLMLAVFVGMLVFFRRRGWL